MTSKRLCNCVVLFDWEDDGAYEIWLDLAEDLFGVTRTVPDVASSGSTASSAKDIAFEKLKEKIRNRSVKPPGVVNALVTRPGYRQIVFGWRVQAGCNITRHKTLLLMWDNALFPWSVEWVSKVFRKLCEAGLRGYGIGYQRAFDLGPDLYAYGIVAGLGFSVGDMRDKHRIGAWARERRGPKRHLVGMLRDVYPMNLLHPAQLEARIGSTTLSKWIEGRPERGSLLRAAGGMGIWSIKSTHLEPVRKKLEEARLLLASIA